MNSPGHARVSWGQPNELRGPVPRNSGLHERAAGVAVSSISPKNRRCDQRRRPGRASPSVDSGAGEARLLRTGPSSEGPMFGAYLESTLAEL